MAEATQREQSTAAGDRIGALDLTKGVLVVCMVVYHCLNYSADYRLGFKFLAFLPPSFIVITGFLISNVYLARRDGPQGRVYRRLILRGARLLLLFTALNIVGQLVRARGHYGGATGVGTFFEHAWDIYILGEGRLAAFEVLIPIAYLLMIAPLLIVLERTHRLLLPLVTVAAFGVVLWLERQGTTLANAHFVCVGLIGMLLGRIPVARLQLLERWWWVGVLAYSGYVALGRSVGQTYLVQTFGSVVALGLIIALAFKAGANGWIQQRLQMLGQYSLLAYIVQIAVLQVLNRFAGRPEAGSWQFLALFLAALVLTALAIEGAAWARGRSRRIDQGYRLVLA